VPQKLKKHTGWKINTADKTGDATQLVYPNVANLLRGKTRQSVPDVAARRLGEDEAYLTVRDILSEASTVADGAVRDILSEASTVADGALSRERSGFYRWGFATLGFSIPLPFL
jgi:hypothetical protein